MGYKRQLSAVLALLLQTVVLQPATAASVTFVPTSPTMGLTAGDLVTLDVLLDFSDVVDYAGVVVGVIGGSFDIVFDHEQVRFVELMQNPVGDPAFGRLPDIRPGRLESWAVGDFDGIVGPVILGSVAFEILVAPPFSTTIRLEDTIGLSAGWVNAGTYHLADVAYGSVTVTNIPLPGAALLLMSAMAVLAFRSRRHG